jgi:hypothetical protein
MKLNGGQALIRSLEMEGVEVMFGLPGGAILPVYDPIIDCATSRAPATWPRGTPTSPAVPASPW